MEKILVVEDDKILRDELCTLLSNNGYMPVDGLPCDLALLDINLDGKSGYDICKHIRSASSIPIIFLTARASTDDEILAFGLGADDYIRKPFDSSVLLARIGRLLKRKTGMVFEKNGLRLDLSSLCVNFDGNTVELTKNETRILACLIEKDLCTRRELIEYLWENDLYIDENTLYVNINRLREKLKGIGAGSFIKTVRGVGYKL